MIGVELFAGFQNAENNMDKFAHCGTDDLHFVFASAGQTLTEVSHDGVVALGGHSRQKERFAHSGITGL